MKSYKFKHPFQGNRKGDIVIEDRFGQLLVKAGSNNVMWGPKDIFRAMGMGLIAEEKSEEMKNVHSLSSIPNHHIAPGNPLPAYGVPSELRGSSKRGTGATCHEIMQTTLQKIQEDAIWGGERISAVTGIGPCYHTGAMREGDEYYCPSCNKRWEA